MPGLPVALPLGGSKREEDTGEKGRGRPTHGRNPNQRRANSSIQPPPKPIPRNALLHNVDGPLVDPALRRLKPHLDEVEGVADHNSAHAAEAARREGAQLRREGRGRRRRDGRVL